MEYVLVTGGTGFLGYHVVNEALKQGYGVRAIVRKHSDVSFLSQLDCSMIYGDITVKQDIEEAVKNCDYVIHCAAKTGQTGEADAFVPVNVDSTRYLAEACRKFKVKRMVYVSSANSFKNGTKTNPGTEASDFMPWLNKSGYASSKYLAQTYIQETCKKHALDAVIVAPTFMLGSYDVKPSSGKLLLQGLKHIVFYPPGGKSFVDVTLVAYGTVNALKRGKNGEVYLLAGQNLSYREFFRITAQICSKRQVLIKVPGFLLKLAGLLGDLLTFFGLNVSFNSLNIKLLTLSNYFSNHKAKQELGLKDTDIKRSVQDAIDWFTENNYI
ncbi:NAD-dependent epimerase/dehydratase family protein [Saccharicrinis sp. FJH54]|uniref:NAD-dependent epimerase/dehydratase family protein n=1 Tax=Saccharicrinis sp. FJH54 TaxID=3344665 RepID=UPI0035D3FCC6